MWFVNSGVLRIISKDYVKNLDFFGFIYREFNFFDVVFRKIVFGSYILNDFLVLV